MEMSLSRTGTTAGSRFSRMSNRKSILIIRLFVVALLAATAGTSVRADFNEAEKVYDQGDYVTALREFKADGSPRSLNNVGLIYFNGEGVRQDKAEAARWFRKAAEAGNMEAQMNLAQML